MAAAEIPSPMRIVSTRKDGSQQVIANQTARELVFGIVGHAGSGASVVAKALKEILESASLKGGAYETELLKARDVIARWATSTGRTLPAVDNRSIEYVRRLQDLGDEMRREAANGRGDNAAVAAGLVLQVKRTRARQRGLEVRDDEPVEPDDRRRAYILDSLRHPAEVFLLRHIYGDAFVLVGVVCEEQKRLKRISKLYRDAGEETALEFMERDSDADQPYGQHVSDTFHLSDFFVDNTADRSFTGPSAEWDIADELGRLVDIITHADIVRPTAAETAMYHAWAAQMQSACLSRQVGAALVDSRGNIVATGKNEVPQAGGGVYGERFAGDQFDARCGTRADGQTFCRNTHEQNTIVQDLIANIPELKATGPERKIQLAKQLRKLRIGSLLEFSRAIHAEMDAILSAARTGVSPVGTRLFVTAFPCHYCARHIVTAGVDEVQYIEPYPKSKALGLHDDAIQIEKTGWKPPSETGGKVLFRPFAGVAPRAYRRAFLKDRELKDRETGDKHISDPSWGTPWHLSKIGYVELEAELARINDETGNNRPTAPTARPQAGE